MTMVAPTMSSSRYAGLNALGFVAWLVISVAAVVAAPSLPVLLIPTVFAVLWNIASYGRIAEQRLWFLHAAPYVTIAGGYDLFWALVEGANNGPWVIGFQPWPWWERPLQIIGLPALLAWPGAVLLLILGHRGREKA